MAERNSIVSLPGNQQLFGLLFDNMLNGFAYCQMLFDTQGQPVDFVYLLVNNQFTQLTGLKNVVGKKVTEVVPGIKEATPELFAIYGRVAQTGKPEKVEIEVKPLNDWFYISVFSPEKGFFGAVFDVITARKKVEQDLQQKVADLEKMNEILVGRENRMAELKQEIKALESDKVPPEPVTPKL